MRAGLLRSWFAALTWVSGVVLLQLAKTAKALGDDHELKHVYAAITLADTTNCPEQCWIRDKETGGTG